MASSSPGECRPAFFEKGPDPLGKILGRRTEGKAVRLAPQLRIETVAERRLKQRLGAAVGIRRPGREAPRQGVGFGPECVRRDDSVDEAQLQRPACAETIA